MTAFGNVFDVKNAIHYQEQYVEQLQSLYDKLKSSEEFKAIEIVSSSILLLHELEPIPRCGVWMIDFDKTEPLPTKACLIDTTKTTRPVCQVTHEAPWDGHNYEDGYLYGLKNLIEFLKDLT